MWSLHSLRNVDVVYHFPCDGNYSIGRKDCDIVISDDQSISRKHAVLTIQAGKVSVKDASSKYGTEVNKKKVTSDQSLHNNDVIKFGQGPSIFRLVHQQLVFCCSNMASDKKLQVQQLVKRLESRMVSNWSSSCTHLVMTGVTITVKVANALSSCCPIVSVSWLEDAVNCVEQRKVLPNTNSYIPEVVDASLLKGSCDNISLKPVYNRRKLFVDKSIYFLDEKQYSSLQYCLKAAGGTTNLITDVNQVETDKITNDNTLVIDPTVRGPVLDKVQYLLQGADLRLISESEIGYAILHCSTHYYCNARAPKDFSQIPSQLPAPSLSCSLLNTQTTCTQTSNATILAYNTMETHFSNDCTHDEGVQKVDETVIEGKGTQNITADASSYDVLASEQITQQDAGILPSNITVLAPDSFALSADTQKESSRKRRRTEEDQCQIGKVKKPVSVCDDSLVDDVSAKSKPVTLSTPASGFLSARKPSSQKSPFSSPYKNDSSVSQLTSLKTETQETENPLPHRTPSSLFQGLRSQRTKLETVKGGSSTEHQYMSAGELADESVCDGVVEMKEVARPQYNPFITSDGFISSRKPPLQECQTVSDEQLSEETLSVTSVVETVSLVRRHQHQEKVVNGNATFRNFKKFKKVLHSHCRPTISRLIGGEDLKAYD